MRILQLALWAFMVWTSASAGSVFGEFTARATVTLPTPPAFTVKDAFAEASRSCQEIKTCTAKDFSKKLDAQLNKVNP